nr:MAG TPA: protein NinB [Herelleviridae sp.]
MSKAINKSEFSEIGVLEKTEDGGLTIKLRFGKVLKRVLEKLIGKELEVNFRLLKYRRSDAQNRWLWGVAYVTIAAWYKETQGETVSKEAIHAHTLQEILDYKIEVEEFMGKEVLVVKGKSTSQLTTKEFSDMVDKLVAYWAQYDCYIQLPKENNFLSEFVKDE